MEKLRQYHTLILFCFGGRVSLYSPGWSETVDSPDDYEHVAILLPQPSEHEPPNQVLLMLS